MEFYVNVYFTTITAKNKTSLVDTQGSSTEWARLCQYNTDTGPVYLLYVAQTQNIWVARHSGCFCAPPKRWQKVTWTPCLQRVGVVVPGTVFWNRAIPWLWCTCLWLSCALAPCTLEGGPHTSTALTWPIHYCSLPTVTSIVLALVIGLWGGFHFCALLQPGGYPISNPISPNCSLPSHWRWICFSHGIIPFIWQQRYVNLNSYEKEWTHFFESLFYLYFISHYVFYFLPSWMIDSINLVM